MNATTIMAGAILLTARGLLRAALRSNSPRAWRAFDVYLAGPVRWLLAHHPRSLIAAVNCLERALRRGGAA